MYKAEYRYFLPYEDIFVISIAGRKLDFGIGLKWNTTEGSRIPILSKGKDTLPHKSRIPQGTIRIRMDLTK